MKTFLVALGSLNLTLTSAVSSLTSINSSTIHTNKNQNGKNLIYIGLK